MRTVLPKPQTARTVGPSAIGPTVRAVLLGWLLFAGPARVWAASAYAVAMGGGSSVESGDAGWTWLWVVLWMGALNLGCWVVFWYWGWLGLARRLEKAERALKELKTNDGALRDDLREHVGKTERGFERHRAELRKLTASGARVQTLERDGPPGDAHRLPVSAPTPWADRLPAAPTQLAGIAPSDHFDLPPPPQSPEPPRQAEQAELGRWFVEEIQSTRGGEAATLWDRYLARVRTRHPDIAPRQLYWDRVRAQVELRFEEQRSDRFLDTGRCWQIELANDAWLFFPSLVGDVRKSDLPGCRIVSTDDAVLAAARLQSYLPPRLMRDDALWMVVDEGEVRYL